MVFTKNHFKPHILSVNSVAKLVAPSFITSLKDLPLRKCQFLRLEDLLPRREEEICLMEAFGVVIDSLMLAEPTYKSWKTIIALIAGAITVGKIEISCDICVICMAEKPKMVAAVIMVTLNIRRADKTISFMRAVSLGQPFFNKVVISAASLAVARKKMFKVVPSCCILNIEAPIGNQQFRYFLAITEMQDYLKDFNVFALSNRKIGANASNLYF